MLGDLINLLFGIKVWFPHTYSPIKLGLVKLTDLASILLYNLDHGMEIILRLIKSLASSCLKI